MDTNKLKKFATEARNRLKAGVAAKMLTLGFDRNGNVPEHLHPQLMQGGSLWNGQLQTESFYHQWNALYNRIKQKGIKEVYEEAAYTWFNRLVAIRILQKNGIIEPVLEYVDAARTPRIVDEARMGRMPQMQEAQRIRLLELLDDDARIKDQFAVLLAAYCHQNPILNACFGGVDDYTELLLPNDILTEGGFVDMLNHTEFITDADFRSPELIGWLYQFYISERKDEVFAKKGKFTADEIPAATQIFTPNWIVKYMVQNTIGRIYLDNHPSAAAEFKPKWIYLVEPSSPTPKEAIYQFKELTELLTGDLACGSGHILNECFDLFYDLYIYEGYSRRETVENIFTHNLRGVDLDTRAKQMAQFALLLKACQKDHSFADAHILPRVLNMPTPIPQEQVSGYLKEFFQENPTNQTSLELIAAFQLMKDADSLGSIMKFDISETTKLLISQTLDYWRCQSIVPEQVKEIKPSMELILSLTEKYAVLVMNPPYMGSGTMNDTLAKYIKRNYEEGKADLFSTFMLLAIDRLSDKGKYGMINMHSWMFLSSFEKLRHSLIDNNHIDSLLHLGPRTFDELSGEVVQNAAYVVNKAKTVGDGTYYRLVEGKDCTDKEKLFLKAKELPKIYYPNVKQDNFEKIPGCVIGYWASKAIISSFASDKSLSSLGDFRHGMSTSDNNRFLRFWHEVSLFNLNLCCKSKEETYVKKWYPYLKGGTYRKWNGNYFYVVNWKNDGEEIKEISNIKYPYLNGNLGFVLGGQMYFFKTGYTWSSLASGNLGVRKFGVGFIFDAKGQCYFIDNREIGDYMLGILNSKVCRIYTDIISPTLDFNSGVISKIPYISIEETNTITSKVNNCSAISKLDWDSHETSWDFETNPLVAIREAFIKDEGFRVATINNEEDVRFDVDKERETAIKMQFANNLEMLVNMFKHEWEERFIQLHRNEEELNRQFIEIYGLQDELTPDVPLNEITILQQGEITINNDQLTWNEDVLMKQLISYAVGVWMGRYKLGKKGLHIAHPEPTDRELQEYWYGGEEVLIDDDAIIPILPQNSPFDDNLSSRIADFIRIVFGAETLTENLNYIEQKLGTTIDQYVQKDFWKDHKKMYQNRPIYWLFSSKKGAFKCLAYMHRMDPYTAERVRSNYLLPYIEYLQNQIGDLESRAAALTTAENRKLSNLRKALDECQEYHERLQVVAEQAIGFDLDDGVVVNYAKFGDVLMKIK